MRLNLREFRHSFRLPNVNLRERLQFPFFVVPKELKTIVPLSRVHNLHKNLAFLLFLNLVEIFAISILGLHVSILFATNISSVSSSSEPLRDSTPKILNFLFTPTYSTILILFVILGLKTLISLFVNLRLHKSVGEITDSVVARVLQSFPYANRVDSRGESRAEIQYLLGRGLSVDLRHLLLGNASRLVESSLIALLFMIFSIVNYVIAIIFLVLGFTFSRILNSKIGSKQEEYSKMDLQTSLENESQVIALTENHLELLVAGNMNRFTSTLIASKETESQTKSKLSWFEGLSKYILEFLIVSSVIGIAILIIAQQGKNSTYADLIISLLIITRIAPPMLRLQTSFSLIRFYKTKAERAIDFACTLIFNVRNHAPNSYDLDSKEFKGVVRVSSIQYSISTRTLLKDLSFRAMSNHPIVLTGESGQGKTTLLHIIMGLLQPDRGSILIDGLDPSAWRAVNGNSIYYVPQTIQLFPGTLKDNLLFHNHSVLEIERVFHRLQLEHLMERFEESISSVTFPALSGGELKRLGLARAILANPMLLIVDEPTSGLDDTNERDVLAFLSEEAQKRTVIITSHSNMVQDYLPNLIELSSDEQT